MRLWSLHPKYLDPQGLVALWREALLAQAVLRGQTRGYRNHPQLLRFKSHSTPVSAIAAYLKAVHAEATERGYTFDGTKIARGRAATRIAVSSGQLEYERSHLLAKLAVRSPALHRQWRGLIAPECHPLFQVRPGAVEPWERQSFQTAEINVAYDEQLAQRIRSELRGSRHITEKKMFGGLAFLRKGLMFVGVSDSSLMARVGKENHADSLGRKHVRPMDFTGKPMMGYVFVEAPGTKSEAQLRFWLERCKDYVATLPPKEAK